MNTKLIATGAALLATAGIAYAAAGATASGEEKNAQGQPSNVAARTTTPSIIKCDGGRELSMNARIGNKPFTFSETAIRTGPGAPGRRVDRPRSSTSAPTRS